VSVITLPFAFTPGTLIKSADVMANYNAIVADYNGNITGANVLGIAEAKVTFAGTGGHAHSGGTGGTPVQLAQGVDLASQATLAVGDDGNFFHVTGTTTITALATKPAQRLAILLFPAACQLTYNAVSLILQNSQNLVTAPGDIVCLMSEGAGNWRELWRRLATAPTTGVGTRRFGYQWVDVSNVQINPVTLRAGVFGMECEIGGTVVTRTSSKTLTMPTALRALVAGSGFITVTNTLKTITSTLPQTFKVGDTVKTSGGRLYTIATWSGSAGTLFQAATATENNVTYTCSNPAAVRTLTGEEVPDALVHVYAFNNAGTLDFYLDTTAPVQGYHPYLPTDRWAGPQLYNDPSGNLDPTLAWANGRTSWSLQGDAGGNYVKTSTVYLPVDAVNLRRQLFVPSGALLELTALWSSLQNSAGGAHQIAATEDETNAAIEAPFSDRTTAAVQLFGWAVRRKVATADGQHAYALSVRSAAGSVTITNSITSTTAERPQFVLQLTEA
jgi:hypothetical protein